MGYLAERVSYLRGVIDGSALDKESAESRIFDAITELLEDIVTSVEGIDEKQESMAGDIEDLAEELDYLYDDFDFEETGEDSEDGGEDGEEDYGDDFYEEFTCPNCGELLPIDDDLLESGDEITLECPGCGETVTISFEDEDGELPDEEYDGGDE